ncbi:BppU family phage baseplate upper protein [Clostridium perfringens]|uniref:BppU family phage baseplate upper protein n=1 Tax=Clostridium perfringens TaxID=1502 RepID=UPI0018E4817A|nr:BppU family phage baseplate upper protein [Clostridium perfringens]MBI6030944.1 BppU family phage baseplate upper protein [Clostridium perfringens]MBI6034293.1 BppU family phage baseplate upper protein [Clostridium perfringens]
MKEIYINADDYNSDSIRTIQGNNNAEEYKIYLQYDNEKIDLTGKTVNLGFLRVGSTEGDIIENLNVTNPKEGEITLKITNKISKRNGTYSCQLAILGEGDFLEHTATFTLTVENNIFSDITKAIADSKDFTYLENILDKASKLSEKLKENTSSATNANSNLESNITEANNINSKLLENTSAATGLNKNLESNIDLAKEVKETIKDLDTKNIEATEKIERLEGLNAKAEELSNNINEALPVKDALIKNTESAKIINNELIATNNDAKVKKTDLDNSLEETKKYISSLDDSKNIVQMQLDINDLKSGLKDNQSLEYHGNNITASNTLEGRTENMIIKGQTLNNLIKNGKVDMVIDKSISPDNRIYRMKTSYPLTAGNTYIGYINITKFEGDSTYGLRIYGMPKDEANGYYTIAMKTGWHKFIWKTQSTTKNFDEIGIYMDSGDYAKNCKITFNSFMLFEQNSESEKIFLTEYFEGLKSFGEAEKEGDKYKISILSHSENLFNYKTMYSTDWVTGDGKIINSGDGKYYSIKVPIFKTGVKYYIKSDVLNRNVIAFLDENNKILKAEVVSLKNPIETPTTPYGTKYILAYLNANGYDNDISNGIVVSLDKTISYASYKDPNKKDILIKEPLKEREYIYEDNGQVKVYRPTKQYTFTGNETSIIKWATVKDENFIGFYITNDDIPNLTSKRSLVVCNNFPSVDGVITKRNMYIAANSVNICIEKSALATPDIEGFRAWLKANPTTIVYQLAEPTVEIVENCVDIDLDTYQEKTYFNILNSIPGSLDFKVPSNIGSLVQSNAKEINNINEFINNFILKALLEMNKDLAAIKIKNGLN